MIVGTTADDETEVEFIPNPKTGGCAVYHIGQTISGVIRAIRPDMETTARESGLLILCTTEDYPVTVEFWDSDSDSN